MARLFWLSREGVFTLPDITMPQLGETVTEGTIIRWMKKVGDEIACDEPLFEVSTDKVDSEVPSPASGYLAEILVAEGATVDVGTKLAVVTDEAPSGDVPAYSAGAPADLSPMPAPAAPRPSQSETPPRRKRRAGPVGTDSDGKGLVLSPVVRKLVAEYGIDPVSVPGTGKGGRITRADVLSFIDRRAAGGGPTVDEATAPARGEPVASAPRSVPGAAGAPVAGSEKAATHSYTPVAGARDEVVPFTNIRRLTAEHMVRSKATSAHTLAVIEADYEGIERVRKTHKDRFREQEGIGLTYLAFIARAVVETLRDYPQLNASVGDDALDHPPGRPPRHRSRPGTARAHRPRCPPRRGSVAHGDSSRDG